MTHEERQEVLASLATTSHWTALLDLWDGMIKRTVTPTDPQYALISAFQDGQFKVIELTRKAVEGARGRIVRKGDQAAEVPH